MKKYSTKISNSWFYFMTVFLTICYLFFSIIWFLTISRTNKWLFYFSNTSIVLTWLAIVWWFFNQYYLIPKKIKTLDNFQQYISAMFETKKVKNVNNLNQNNQIKSQNFKCFIITWIFVLFSFTIIGLNYGFYQINSFLTIITWIAFGIILSQGIFFCIKILKK